MTPTGDSLRVVMYTDSAEPSGMGEHMLALSAELARGGEYKVVFACCASPAAMPFLRRAEEAAVRSAAVVSPHDLHALLMRETPDIFHIHAGIGWEAHEAVYVARRAGVPAVVRTEHLPYLLTDPVQQRDYRLLAQLVDRFICVSHAARAGYVEAGLPPGKYSVVLNGIPPYEPVRDRQGLLAELHLPPGACLALTVGRMTEQKGHRYLLQAAALLANMSMQPNLYFLLAGDGPLLPELLALAASLGLAEPPTPRVRFLGRRSDLPRLLGSSDLFVLPSLFEGLPISVLEAMHSSLPVIGTVVTGTSEAVEHGHTGLLVPPADPAALAGAIAEAASSPSRAREWGREGLRRARERFSAERMARETVEVYRRVARASQVQDP